ncbi:MAG: PorP/SprF family type IX secretion system membrane protein [Bacteroidaceae bacterium]|nr:PorP/SprF family type IX secretion system membrane protein [Bacteroidaceae bacterium]
MKNLLNNICKFSAGYWRGIILFLVLNTQYSIFSVECSAQYDPSLTHFWMTETQYNPAAVGNSELLRAAAVYSAQFAGYENAPTTLLATVDLPVFFIGPNHGMGAYFMNDKAGFFSLKNIALQYAYHRKLFAGQMSIGVQADLLNESFDGSKLDLEDNGKDQAFSNGTIDGSKLDLSAGFAYKWKDLRVAASVKHITAPTILLGETNEIRIKRSYYFTAGYNIKLKNPLFSIHPDVFWMFDGVAHKTYIHARAQYDNGEKMMFGGLSYSPSTSAAIILGGRFHGIVLSYSYEAFTSGVGVANGNHEVVLKYEAPLNLYKKGRNRHKSVRLL